MKLRSKLTVLALVSVLILTVFSGCQGRETPEESSESVPSLPSSSSSSSSVASSAPEVVDTVEKIIIDYVDAVAEKKELNSDTVGWLHIPGSIIDDVVLCRTDSNQYYMRLNFEQKKDFNGVYYADKRSIFGTGTREELGVNTCIYGHALTDNEDSPNYSIRFGPLHDFRDPDMAEEMPYLCFTTEKENLVFEIFAVFVANNDNADVPYNRGDIPAAEFCEMVRTEILPRSIYD
ncbi:class B sortase, partial [Ruminococcaceae bacterium OttesenSCG-928-L11]|nr:class B sortase [Ruminococcaceae bacterium OttesenSCG-928-L11]